MISYPFVKASNTATRYFRCLSTVFFSTPDAVTSAVILSFCCLSFPVKPWLNPGSLQHFLTCRKGSGLSRTVVCHIRKGVTKLQQLFKLINLFFLTALLSLQILDMGFESSSRSIFNVSHRLHRFMQRGWGIRMSFLFPVMVIRRFLIPLAAQDKYLSFFHPRIDS